VKEREMLSPQQEGDEFLLMGLRLREGIEPARYAALCGKELAGERIVELVALGLLESKDRRLRATPEGFLVLAALVADLAA
jgi:oxygen-independent coproporphyrinogen-3 oxidase